MSRRLNPPSCALRSALAKPPVRHRAGRFLAILAAAWLATGNGLAQDYSVTQTLRGTPTGEGEPGLHHGTQVAIDGDLALVAQKPGNENRTRIRGYVRTAGVWQRNASYDRNLSNRIFLDMALSGNVLILSTVSTVGGQGSLAIYRHNGASWAQEYNLSATNPNTGYSLAIAGDIAVAGTPPLNASSAGSARVLQHDGDGNWSSTTLQPSNLQADSRFGSSVAIVSGAVVVGAPYEDVLDNAILRTDAGAAYVFELTTPNWNEVARLTSEFPEATAHFGDAVAISGLDEGIPSRILVGAPREDGTYGAVYGYRRSNDDWIQSMRLVGNQESPFQQFGSDVALDGAFGVIGAETYRYNDEILHAGAIYGARFNSDFSNATLTRRFDPLPAQQARVGAVVAIDRDGPTVLVGVPDAELYGINHDQGAVLTSRGSGGVDFPPLARAFDLGQSLYSSFFGWSISAAGDAVAIGAPFESVGNQFYTGAVYLFRRNSAGTWLLETRLQSPDGLPGDVFGHAVALHGDSLLVGAPGATVSGVDNRGRAYAFRRSGGAWSLEMSMAGECNEVDRRRFGRDIAFDGTRAMISGVCPDPNEGVDPGTSLYTRDSDGNWSADIIVEAYRMSGGGWDAGTAVVGVPVLGGEENAYNAGGVYQFLPNQQGEWRMVGAAQGSAQGQGFGYDLDVRDGLIAIASHAPDYPVVVRRRSGNFFLPEASLIIAELGANDPVRSVAVGTDHVAVGAALHTSTVSSQGTVYRFTRSAGSWTQRQALVAPSPQAGANFGYEIELASDGTLFVGAPFESATVDSQGGVHVFAPPSPLVFSDGFE